MSPSAERPAAEATAARSRRVTRPDDVTERAAERAAARASGPRTAPVPLRAATSGRGTAPAATESVAPSSAVEAVLAQGGRPLDPGARAVFEARLGHDLGRVRVHDGPVAQDAARHLHALAFTAGSHVVLGAAAADPRTALGRGVLAHELVHTVQARSDGPDGPLRRAMAPPAADATIPAEKRERIVRTMGEIVSAVPAAPAGRKPGEAAPEADAAARRIAAYLVVTEDLVDEQIAALLEELHDQVPVLFQAAALGGRLFSALRELGVLQLATAIGWYIAMSLRDTLAGDFVEDPTALGIALRTLLTLVPGLDTAADVEDVVANLLYGVLDPTKLTSVGWWFGVVLTLIGFFPAFGTVIKGTVKGLGALAKAGVDAVSPRFLRELERSGVSLDSAKDAIGQVLATADAWRAWAIDTFTLLVTTAISFVTSALGTVTGALAQQAVRILDALRDMLRKAPAMLPQAATKIQRMLEDALIAVGLRPSRAEEALTGVAKTAGKHSGQAIEEALLRLVIGGADPTRIDEIRKMTDKVVTAFESPAAFAEALKTIVDQRRKLGGPQIDAELAELQRLKRELAITDPTATLATTLSREAAAYVAAVKRLAVQRGTGVVELHMTGPTSVLLVRRDKTGALARTPETLITDAQGFIKDDDFMTKVIAGGEAILDFAALEITDAQGIAEGQHGALTHVLHDLVADKVLKSEGGVARYRASMAWLQAQWDAVEPGGVVADPDFTATAAWKAGTALWVGTFDRLTTLARPENLWPALRPLLNLAPKEL